MNQNMGKFCEGEKVSIRMMFSEKPYEKGIITQLWRDSNEAKITGFYDLDKYKVQLLTDCGKRTSSSMWIYGSDLVLL